MNSRMSGFLRAKLKAFMDALGLHTSGCYEVFDCLMHS